LVYSHLTDYYRLTGHSEQAVAYGEQALTFASELDDFTLQILAHQRLGHVYYAVGAYRRSVELLKRNISSLTGDLSRERFSIGSLPAAHSRSYMIAPLVELGEFSTAVPIGEEAVRIADAADTAHSQVLARHAVGLTYLCKGDIDRAMPLLEQTLHRCQVGHMPLDTRVLASALGYAYALAGQVADGISLLEQAVQQSEALSIFFRYALWLAGLGIVEAMGQLNTRLPQERGVQLAVRLGIHTGMVVVGDVGDNPAGLVASHAGGGSRGDCPDASRLGRLPGYGGRGVSTGLSCPAGRGIWQHGPDRRRTQHTGRGVGGGGAQ
jgi:tetratricopeptide (TPR) repeat protein